MISHSFRAMNERLVKVSCDQRVRAKNTGHPPKGIQRGRRQAGNKIPAMEARFFIRCLAAAL
jgi:hypothetical protein